MQADDISQNIPGGPTGGATQNFNGLDPVAFNLYLVFRQAELVAIFACRLQAAKTASGKRRYGTCMLFA